MGSTPNPKSLLNAKQRQMHPAAQVQTLVRIGKRALGKADHLSGTMLDYYAHFGTADDVAKCHADIAAARAKAARAADEMMEIAETSDDFTLRRKAQLARAAVR